MNPLVELLAPCGEHIDALQLSRILGWSVADAAELLRSGDLRHVAHPSGAYVSKGALLQFLAGRRHYRRQPPFVPVRRAGLLPLRTAVAPFDFSALVEQL